MKFNHHFKDWLVNENGVRLNPKYRFLLAYGGRGSGKSHAIAELLILIATQRKTQILCCREFQNSIDDSVMSLLMEKADKIAPTFFHTVNNKIIGKNGSTFAFIGLARNLGSVKSKEGYDIAWVEEAQYISYKAWEVLDPTIRKEGSQIILSMNRDSEDAVIDKSFIQSADKPPRTSIVNVNYVDNPYPIEQLKELAEHCKRVAFPSYQHIWMGA